MNRIDIGIIAPALDMPGMGLELNEQAVRKHIQEGETYFDET